MENKENITKEFIDSLKNLDNCEADKMRRALAEARQEWEFATAYFDCVDDPELIEYAIYNQNAAEKKIRLFNKKGKGLKAYKKLKYRGFGG